MPAGIAGPTTAPPEVGMPCAAAEGSRLHRRGGTRWGQQSSQEKRRQYFPRGTSASKLSPPSESLPEGRHRPVVSSRSTPGPREGQHARPGWLSAGICSGAEVVGVSPGWQHGLVRARVMVCFRRSLNRACSSPTPCGARGATERTALPGRPGMRSRARRRHTSRPSLSSCRSL